MFRLITTGLAITLLTASGVQQPASAVHVRFDLHDVTGSTSVWSTISFGGT